MSQSPFISRRATSVRGRSNSMEHTGLFHQRVNQSGRSPSPGGQRRNFDMAATPGTKLAQEIHDEFLVCKICLEGYKNPKSLNCLHTFCENCIENHVMSESTYKKYSDYREFTCPLCRKRTQLPIGGVKKLPDNFLVSSLSEVIVRQKPSKFPFCDICKLVNKRHREAASKCLDCAKLLCKTCVELHRETKVTSNHSIFDVEIEKDIECKEHEDEVVRFYCEPCETCICVLCTFNEHKDHEITQFGEAVAKYKDNIQDMLSACKDKIERFDVQLESVNHVEEIIQEAEKKVHETAIQFIADIRSREKQLIEELHNLYGNELMDMIENKKDMSTSVDGLRSTCNLTEVILKGKDIELLLLKKDVQKKLSTLGDIEIKPLPSTSSKVVTFQAGSFDLGVIHDKDRPILSQMRAKKIGDNRDDQSWPTFETRETQTEHSNVTGSKNLHSDSESGSGSESESDSDDDSDDESDSDDDNYKGKKCWSETGVQTETHASSSSSSESDSSDSEDESPKVEMKDQSVATDVIPTEERGVNTRSRSLQSLSSVNRRSPPKDDDNSLAARRRRRRERAANTYHSMDVPDSTDADDYETRKQRSRDVERVGQVFVNFPYRRSNHLTNGYCEPGIE